MALVVQKFGGTSVATPDRIMRVAERILARLELGDQPILVISAMAGVTNDLAGLAHQFSGEEGHSEYDVVVSAGEQICAGLMALALSRLGIKARSFLAWQVPFLTDNQFSAAEVCIGSLPVLEAILAEGGVPVVAGFQGVTATGRQTTLGRGGSDLTAVALAAALNTTCETYKDVDGIYTTDPNIVPSAQCLKYVDYTDMLAMAAHGSKVLQARSVAYAAKHAVPIHVRSSFTRHPGTHIAAFPGERPSICGVAVAMHLFAVDMTFASSSWSTIIEALHKKYLPFNVVKKTSAAARFLFNRTDLQEVQNFCKSMPSIASWTMGTMRHALSRLTVIGKEASQQKESLKRQLAEAHIATIQDLPEDASLCESCLFLVRSTEAERGVRLLHSTCGLDVKE
ncbi:MAG: aspartate kinase [Holosporales bacterium]|jgi:aspartate kinase|nr:aspartate kinase [Holosporales bacterium]